MRRERPGHTLQATALINEAYLRLIGQTRTDSRSRAQFFGMAAQFMRRILVDHARARHSAKRQGPHPAPVSLDEAAVFAPERAPALMALDEALDRLGSLDRERRGWWNCGTSAGSPSMRPRFPRRVRHHRHARLEPGQSLAAAGSGAFDSERWRRIERIYHEALARAPTPAEYLQQACGDDPVLVSEVQSLIESHAQSSEFLETPVLHEAASRLAAERPRPGACVGHYG